MDTHDGSTQPPEGPPNPLESTVLLLRRIRAGDNRARGILIDRYRSTLERWAHRRLPRGSLLLTGDVVQNALIRALDKLEDFEPRREGSFLAWLSRIVRNLIATEWRLAARRPQLGELDEELPDPGESPIETALGKELISIFEAAVEDLPPKQKSAVILHVEFGLGLAEIARELGLSSIDAARKNLERGLKTLAPKLGVDLGRS